MERLGQLSNTVTSSWAQTLFISLSTCSLTVLVCWSEYDSLLDANLLTFIMLLSCKDSSQTHLGLWVSLSAPAAAEWRLNMWRWQSAAFSRYNMRVPPAGQTCNTADSLNYNTAKVQAYMNVIVSACFGITIRHKRWIWIITPLQKCSLRRHHVCRFKY